MTDATTGAGLRPFGLSLDPLVGESPAGFVLRLAHRLHVSPHELARRTGLTEQDRLGRARASLSTLLSPDEVSRFALTTRLDPRKVRAMTLEPLASRCPPAARSIDEARAGRVYSMHTDRWLFPTTARYCPHCHKPINFSSRTQLVPRPAATGVHPAHCRSSLIQDVPTSRPGAPRSRSTAPSTRTRPARSPAQDPLSPPPTGRGGRSLGCLFVSAGQRHACVVR
ncbi:TniQ family protein [Streptomyces murinus]|uniref:TniQ family protein n=1 Tax=Streptomyces murinus TaxID=33900 RepID=UPI003820DC20